MFEVGLRLSTIIDISSSIISPMFYCRGNECFIQIQKCLPCWVEILMSKTSNNFSVKLTSPKLNEFNLAKFSLSPAIFFNHSLPYSNFTFDFSPFFSFFCLFTWQWSSQCWACYLSVWIMLFICKLVNF